MTGRFLTAPNQPRPSGPRPWYRLRRYQLPIVAVIIALAFFSDRYDHYTTSQRGGQLRSFHQTIKGDLATCTQGLDYSTRAWHALGAHPTGGARANVASTAKAAEANCTPVSDDGGVYALSTLQVPGALGKVGRLSLAVYQLSAWAYPNAAKALLDIETLAQHPGDRTTSAALAKTSGIMKGDAASADKIFAQAAGIVGTHVSSFGLPSP